MNQTQGLGNAPFSVSHKVVLEKNDRLRVANQLLTLLQQYSKRKTFKNLKVLDIGCSSGVITNHIAKYSGKTMGLDVDKKAIEEAKKNYQRKNLSFKAASGSFLSFKNKSFDIVICNQVYSYVSNQKEMMKEIYRTLKDGGFCLFTGDNLLYPIESLYHLPFIKWFPKNIQKYYLRKIGHKNIYVGNYKTYWYLKKLCSNFQIHDYTLEVLNKPKKFKFKKLIKYQKFIKRMPRFILRLFEPFFPTFVFILQKT